MAVSERPGAKARLVGSLRDFEPGTCRLVHVEGREIGIINTGEDVFAILNRCPHMGGGICWGTVGGIMEADLPESITYDESRKAIRCPWHGWQFTLDDGYAVGGFSRKRLQRYPVEVRDDEVYVYVRTALKREEHDDE